MERGLVVDQGEIEQRAHTQHLIASSRGTELAARTAQHAANVFDGITGQAHADRLMASSEFVFHSTSVRKSLTAATRDNCKRTGE